MTALAVAGCLADLAVDHASLPAAQRPYATFLCSDGRLVTAVVDATDRCNVLLTAPVVGPANEVSIAVDPTNPQRLVAGAKDYSLGPDEACGIHRVWAGTYWSRDGGFTWDQGLMPGHDQTLAGQSTNPLAGHHCASDPVVFWDFEGSAYYGGLSGIAAPAGRPSENVWVAKSQDGGQTYDQINAVARTDSPTMFYDKEWFTVDPRTGNIYAAWEIFIPGTVPAPTLDAPMGRIQMAFSRSLDEGRTWSAPQILSDSLLPGTLPAPAAGPVRKFIMPQVDSNGTIYATWMEFDESEARFVLVKSSDEGETWTAPRAAMDSVHFLYGTLPPTEFRTFTMPILGIDRSSGETDDRLYLTWAAFNGSGEGPESGTDLDVWLAWSDDGGEKWSPALRVNDDGGASAQFMPWLDVGPRGDVHVVFYDRRDDPANHLAHLYYAHVANGTVAPNLRISDQPANASLSYHQGGAEYMGDYIGVTEGTNGWVHPVWLDTRNGRAEIFTTVVQR